MDKTSPIGVIDSGIGGFSVARRVQRLLPEEDLVYLGDGAHIPYGNHPEETIVAMARYMFSFMEEKGVKALLVACNTISCVVDRCRDAVSCPAFNAVQAGADAVAAMDVEEVGVISTVFNQLGAMLGGGVVGAIFFAVVFLIGHSMNMAINLLGAYVHTNRLQFVEFFGKFYEGGGRAYAPFAANTKHFQIKEEK